MTTPVRRRYRVRFRTAVAGTFLAAASATALIGAGAAPALASVARPSAESAFRVIEEPGVRTARAEVAATMVEAAVPTLTADGRTSGERLAGVGADLDRAVMLRLVTAEQASGFYAQMERRMAAGL